MASKFPDVSDLLQAKAHRRRELAALSWEEKVKIVERMKQLLPRNAWQEPRKQASVRHTLRPELVEGSESASHTQ